MKKVLKVLGIGFQVFLVELALAIDHANGNRAFSPYPGAFDDDAIHARASETRAVSWVVARGPEDGNALPFDEPGHRWVTSWRRSSSPA
jgi:hypothetical protein